MVSEEELIAMLYDAFASEVGISVAASNVGRLQQRLYQTRAKLADPDLSLLMLSPDPARPETHLFICKTRIQVAGEGKEEDAQDAHVPE